MGENRINMIMKRIISQTDLEESEKRLTNSARKTLVKKLKSSRVERCAIVKRHERITRPSGRLHTAKFRTSVVATVKSWLGTYATNVSTCFRWLILNVTYAERMDVNDTTNSTYHMGCIIMLQLFRLLDSPTSEKH